MTLLPKQREIRVYDVKTLKHALDKYPQIGKKINDMASSSSQRQPASSKSFLARAQLENTSSLAAYLFRLIAIKQTNLCVSADVTTTRELLGLAEDVGDYICLFKTHADIVTDFGDRTVKGLREIARRKRFLIFEDRKFSDIGSTFIVQSFVIGFLLFPLEINC